MLIIAQTACGAERYTLTSREISEGSPVGHLQPGLELRSIVKQLRLADWSLVNSQF